MRHSNTDAAVRRQSQQSKSLGRLFGDLRVRPKLMVLHNIFFLVLTMGVYLALIPQFEDRVAGAEAREVALVRAMFSQSKPLLNLPGMELYAYREGTPESISLPSEIQQSLDAAPGATLRDPGDSAVLYRKDPDSGLYCRITLPHAYYDRISSRAKWSLLIVLGIIYCLSVLLLEFVIMPRYVHRRLRLLLAADRATQQGDTEHELIREHLIPGDEIGQIMRSRNATIAQLRKHEQDLAEALARLEVTADDLTRKNALLETAKRNLADQDRLVSLGLLSASVAHELNTPLSVLRGSVEKLLETVRDRAAQDRLGRMLRVTDRLRKISESLLDFARVRRQELEPVSIQAVVEEAWELVAIDEKASSVDFTNNITEQDLVVGNQERLVQVFVNLLRNALSAVRVSGIIQVQSERFTNEGQAWISVSVEDNGPGIPADVLPQIFEAFVTSRLDSRGTGLGLTVAEGIIHQHDGTIQASNRPGGGARLEVRLRAARSEVSA